MDNRKINIVILVYISFPREFRRHMHKNLLMGTIYKVIICDFTNKWEWIYTGVEFSFVVIETYKFRVL